MVIKKNIFNEKRLWQYNPRVKLYLSVVLILFTFDVTSYGDKEWNEYPSLGLMTSFIKAPYEKNPSIEQWGANLGVNFDASDWVKQFKEAGMEYLIFYAKWVDGYCLYDTGTTDFKSPRDFLKEISEACENQNLPLVIYYNAFCDNNPDFEKWALKDSQGNKIVLNERVFPHNMQTNHSPFGEIALKQTQEILANNPRVDGIWLDVPYHRTNTLDPYVKKAFERMYGKAFRPDTSLQQNQQRKPGEEERIEPLQKISNVEFRDFEGRSVALYIRKAKELAAKYKPSCKFTANSSARPAARWDYWARNVSPYLDYLSWEGHHYDRTQEAAQFARALPWPVELGVKINKSWYAPYRGPAPGPMFSFKKSIALVALGLCQGANVWICTTPGYDGSFGADMNMAKDIGIWYKNIKPYLNESEQWGNIGLIHGTFTEDKRKPVAAPTIDDIWGKQVNYEKEAWDEIAEIQMALENKGYLTHVIGQWPVFQNRPKAADKGWPRNFSAYDTLILPERSALKDTQAEDIIKYVNQGGKVIIFGHGGMFDEHGQISSNDPFLSLLGLKRTSYRASNDETDNIRVIADSTYHSNYDVGNIVTPSGFWSSNTSPMPHWIEIQLPEETIIQGLELVNRDNGYQIQDFSIEVINREQWKVVYSERDSNSKNIKVKFERPLKTKSVKINIERENIRGQNRQAADIQEVRLYNTEGNNIIDHQIDANVAIISDKEYSFPLYKQVQPVTAVAMHGAKNIGSALVYENSYGKGKAYYVATSEACLNRSADKGAWEDLMLFFDHTPLLTAEPQNKYQLIVNKYRKGFILHAIDKNVFKEDAEYVPQRMKIRISKKLLNGIQKVKHIKSDLPDICESEFHVQFVDGDMVIDTIVDPVASLLLE